VKSFWREADAGKIASENELLKGKFEQTVVRIFADII
jgi:hypothetical protein